jgi:nicotinamidase/pyrazinamidase
MTRIVKRAVLGLVVILGALVVIVAAVLWWATAATSGPHIGAYDDGRKALLVVDIQEDYTGRNARKPYRDGDQIVAATNRLIENAGPLGFKVVYIQNEITNPVLRLLAGGLNAPGDPGTRVDARILQTPGARTFTKGRSDAFSNPALDAYLRELRVDELVIVGLDGAYCVKTTMRGALNRGYKVTVVTDGVATESGQSMEALAREYAGAGAAITTSQALLSEASR